MAGVLEEDRHGAVSTDRDVTVGDCVEALASVADGAARLVYVDPPFFTQREWKSEAGSFDDRFDSMDAYLLWFAERLDAMHRVLAPTGVLVVHLDHHAVDYVSVYLLAAGALLRPPLGGPGLLGEWIGDIVWKRTQGSHSSASKSLGHVHDTLVCYSRGSDWTFHPPPGAESSVWDDVFLSSSSAERVGYPTQKPVALLERLVLTFTDPGDLVVDPMCGSGTTLVAAVRNGRVAFGCDISAAAVEIARRRLDEERPQLQLPGVA